MIDNLNLDGWPELVFANLRVGGSAASGYVNDSFVYWGLIFANSNDNTGEWRFDSTIYWGSASGHSETDSTALPTSWSWGSIIGDDNGDGWDDIAFSSGWGDGGCEGPSFVYYSDALPGSAHDGSSDTTISRIYWGHAGGLGQGSPTELTTPYPGEVSIGDGRGAWAAPLLLGDTSW